MDKDKISRMEIFSTTGGWVLICVFLMFLYATIKVIIDPSESKTALLPMGLLTLFTLRLCIILVSTAFFRKISICRGLIVSFKKTARAAA